ncbi:hypothetical protein [Rhizobacter sp. Root404]|uniref:hypothetical protein n=1 Tax=Rhizobacter sp. Root404 TaxID=1736528 RepID=UPI00138EEA00|nr:hypothetical protein [Rhizobacter sp. Root404]
MDLAKIALGFFAAWQFLERRNRRNKVMQDRMADALVAAEATIADQARQIEVSDGHDPDSWMAKASREFADRNEEKGITLLTDSLLERRQAISQVFLTLGKYYLKNFQVLEAVRFGTLAANILPDSAEAQALLIEAESFLEIAKIRSGKDSFYHSLPSGEATRPIAAKLVDLLLFASERNSRSGSPPIAYRLAQAANALAIDYLPPDALLALQARVRLVIAGRDQGDISNALETLSDVASLIQTDQSKGYDLHLAVEYYRAVFLLEEQRVAEARITIEGLIPKRAKLSGEYDVETCATRSLYGRILCEAKDFVKLREELAWFTKNDASLPLEAKTSGAAYLSELRAELLWHENERAKAISELRSGVAKHNEAFGPEHPETLRLRYRLVQLLIQIPDLSNALLEVSNIAKIQARVLGDNHPNAQKSKAMEGKISRALQA